MRTCSHPVVIIDPQKKQVTYTGLHYYLAHFSKYVRPGALRMQTVGSQGGVRVMAFKRPDDGVVAELMNSRREDNDVNLSCACAPDSPEASSGFDYDRAVEAVVAGYPTGSQFPGERPA